MGGSHVKDFYTFRLRSIGGSLLCFALIPWEVKVTRVLEIFLASQADLLGFVHVNEDRRFYAMCSSGSNYPLFERTLEPN